MKKILARPTPKPTQRSEYGKGQKLLFRIGQEEKKAIFLCSESADSGKNPNINLCFQKSE